MRFHHHQLEKVKKHQRAHQVAEARGELQEPWPESPAEAPPALPPLATSSSTSGSSSRRRPPSPPPRPSAASAKALIAGKDSRTAAAAASAAAAAASSNVAASGATGVLGRTRRSRTASQTSEGSGSGNSGYGSSFDAGLSSAAGAGTAAGLVWTAQECDRLRSLAEAPGGGGWDDIASKLPGRTEAQCRAQWHALSESKVSCCYCCC
jgi:Myb-like DNA-binding domain